MPPDDPTPASSHAKAQDQLLLALLVENNRALAYWRDRSWNAVRDAGAAMVALAGFNQFAKEAKPVVGVVALALWGIASIYLYKNFTRYRERLAVGAGIEEALGLYRSGAFVDGKALLPAAMRQPKASRRGTGSFVLALLVLASAVAFGSWYQPAPKAGAAAAAGTSAAPCVPAAALPAARDSVGVPRRGAADPAAAASPARNTPGR